METQNEDTLISGYVRGYTWPVQWVSWWAGATDEATKEQLGAVLFEPDGQSLRDLSPPEVREEVIRIVLGSRSLLRVVADEVARVLDKLGGEVDEE